MLILPFILFTEPSVQVYVDHSAQIIVSKHLLECHTQDTAPNHILIASPDFCAHSPDYISKGYCYNKRRYIRLSGNMNCGGRRCWPVPQRGHVYRAWVLKITLVDIIGICPRLWGNHTNTQFQSWWSMPFFGLEFFLCPGINLRHIPVKLTVIIVNLLRNYI